MNIYFADRRMEILGVGTTKKTSTVLIENDVFTEEIDSGVSTLTFDIHYQRDNRLEVEAMCAVGNYLLREYEGQQGFFTIIESETNNENQTINIYAEDAGLDLLNDLAGPFISTAARSIEWYINEFARYSGFTVNVNEIPNKQRRLGWDGTSTVSERIRSVATQFDNAEIGYSFEIKGLKVVNKYINVYEKRGKDVGQQLRMGKEVRSIRVRRSIANLVTALNVTGGTPDGKDTPINLVNYNYDDGDIYVQKATGRVMSRTALEVWSRYLSDLGNIENFEGHIIGQFSYETVEKSELCNRAVSQLKKQREPEVNYDVELNYLPQNLKIGDTVNIVDDHGELYLSARVLVLTQKASINKHEAVFGEFLIKDAGISERLKEIANELENSDKFKTRYTWIAYADDASGGGISLDPTGKEYMGISANHIIEEPDISNPLIYTWSKVVGKDGEDGFSPIVETSKTGGTTTIEITDAQGTKTAEIEDGSSSVTLTLTSTAGNVFEDSYINTTLFAHVYMGGKELSNFEILQLGTIKWYSITPDPSDPTVEIETYLGRTGQTYSISATSKLRTLNIIAKLEGAD